MTTDSYTPTSDPPLVDLNVKVLNSLHRQLEPLSRVSSLPLRVYTCGPTVYANAHLGHARTYTSLDTIRRILTDYFGIEVTWCMNITDVDDKIINFFNEGNTGFNTPFEYSRDREKAFFADMERLNVRAPDSLLRVSEVIPEIVEFIGELENKGFAYFAGGNVWFDVLKYQSEFGSYAELEPESFNPQNVSQTRDAETGEGKRSVPDFALWKGAKPGEPSWDSPWGKGRPGWHIECSTMSGLFFGEQFDVHCGGLDLKFPHHSNEIAQSQSRFGKVPWVRTWLHTGQLKINGEKMAKSVGNFKTIAGTLETYNWRELRMAFSLVQWQNVLELSPDLFESSQSLLSRIDNFLGLAEGLRGSGSVYEISGYHDADRQFERLLGDVKNRVRSAFADNFDVPTALNAIRTLIDGAYVSPSPNHGLIVAGARFVHKIMNVLGFGVETVGLTSGSGGLGLVAKELAEYRQTARANARNLLTDSRSVLKILGVDPRSPRPEDPAEQAKWEIGVRLLSEVQGVLGGLDELRDESLPSIGIKLEDQQNGSVVFKVGVPEARKPKAPPPQGAAAAPPKPPKQAPPPKPPVVLIDPSEHFKAQTEKYSEWDKTGFPTKMVDGKELTRGQFNKVKKEYEVLVDKWKKAHPDE
jgi:cysteinyl-tRNA synthetase